MFAFGGIFSVGAPLIPYPKQGGAVTFLFSPGHIPNNPYAHPEGRGSVDKGRAPRTKK